MKKDTLLGRAGREHGARVVNPPVQRASTVVFPTVAEMETARRERHDPSRLFYGTWGTETTFAFTSAMAALEGGWGGIAVSSGLAAITATLQALVKSGEHVLLPDSVYDPVRAACDGVLRDLGIESSYYDPRIGADIESQIRPNTKLLYLESPGSMTFEVQDVPALVAVARARGIPTAIDNTWATGYFFNAFAHGVDVSINAATKYVAGHSDVVLGAIVATEQLFSRIRKTVGELGFSASPDDCWLALRGLRTLGVRLRAHEQNTLRIARFLQERPEVDRVLYPALPGAPGHDIWKRDFTGASGLFAFVFSPKISEAQAIAFVERLKLFAIGASWGGFESLARFGRPGRVRSLPEWKSAGPLVRLHVGLEDVEDLLEDLRSALDSSPDFRVR